MKKYVKPEIFFEQYELSQHVAACAFDLDERTLNNKTCAFKGDPSYGYPENMVIYITNDACDVSGEAFCYQAGGTDGFNTFNS